MKDAIDSGALFSPCRTWRYSLWRRWSFLGERYLVFVGLNPSTADEREDDPTIRRCIGFSKRLGYDGYIMLNIFAFRATFPKDMMKAVDPIGPDNDSAIISISRQHTDCVAAWGIHGSFLGREKEIINIIPNLLCLGVTKEGHPRHPLYLKGDTKLVPFSVASIPS